MCTLGPATSSPEKIRALVDAGMDVARLNLSHGSYADHEQAYYDGPRPVISHYNNQFDMVLGGILQLARTEDPAWWDLFEPLARHVVDIDLYHTTRDRPAYNGGLFWFTDHYLDAATSTHRTYSRANRPAWNNTPPYNSRPGSSGTGSASAHSTSTGGPGGSAFGCGELAARKWSSWNPVRSLRRAISITPASDRWAATRRAVEPPAATGIGRSNRTRSRTGGPASPVRAAAAWAMASSPRTAGKSHCP